MAVSTRKERIGEVFSNKMDKTVVVKIERLDKHPVYHKYIRKSSKLKAHDAENKCRIGDKVRVRETRPLSKEKRWRVIEILKGNL
jgi:small subunit ribosomal protein S17